MGQDLQQRLALAHSLYDVQLVELEVGDGVHQRWAPLSPSLCFLLHTFLSRHPIRS